MNLFQESITFSNWFSGIMRAFFQLRPKTTAVVICAAAAASMTRLLSFLLPLKVILLAGSSGVPRYFPFIDPAAKTYWIIGLSILAIGFYLVTLLLEALVARLSQDAGQEILNRANELTVVKDQETTIQGYYAQFCGICASIVFLGAAFLLLLVINHWLILFLLLLTSSMYFFSAWALSGGDINPGALKSYIIGKTSDYLKILSSITFLSAFLVILIPFLTSNGGNIILAIISIILIRRSLSFIESSIRDSARLNQKKHQVNALIFPEAQMIYPEKKEINAVRNFFHKAGRQEKAQKELGQLLDMSGKVEAQWMDPTASGIYMFSIALRRTDTSQDRLYQQQAFPPESVQLFENEDYLFRQLSRTALKAPALVTRFMYDPFVCQILEYGRGERVNPEQWKNVYDALLEHYWALQPPDPLIKAYRASHMLLHQRLNQDLVSRVEVAVDTGEEEEDVKRFQSRLNSVRALIRAVPLYIHNPEINRNNVVQTDQNSVNVMTWGRWFLAPVGIVMPYAKDRVISMADNLKKYRNDVSEDLGRDHLYFVFNCHKLEKEINRGAYKEAMGTINKLLSDPYAALFPESVKI